MLLRTDIIAWVSFRSLGNNTQSEVHLYLTNFLTPLESVELLPDGVGMLWGFDVFPGMEFTPRVPGRSRAWHFAEAFPAAL